MTHYRSIFSRRTLGMAAFLGAGLLALGFEQSRVEAKEPVERFLDNLRRLEMHDISVMYLSSLRLRPNLEANLKAKLPYEEGVSLMAAARATYDPLAKLTLLDQSVAKFQEFVKTSPRHARGDGQHADGKHLGGAGQG